ncbi:uncharacterized protein LOC141594786 [Silene latifolia]|uniref:uncharacterized protein LOC141594786 n=1 Tax=Silene latifolia TaxID=37657 RepID=UPI003D780FD7
MQLNLASSPTTVVEGNPNSGVACTSGVGGVSKQAKKWSDIAKSKTKLGMSLYFHQESKSVTEIDVALDEIADELKFWEFTLMGHLIGSKPPLQKVIEFVTKSWSHIASSVVQYFKKGWFSFRFKTQEDMNNVMKEGPWKMGSYSLILKQWHPYFSFEMERTSIVHVWVLFPDLDPYLWSSSVLSKMSSRIGKPMFADVPTTNKDKLSFARVMIEVDIASNLPLEISLNTPFGPSTQGIQYEWLPFYCSECGKMGHKKQTCKKNKAKASSQTTKAKGKEVKYVKKTSPSVPSSIADSECTKKGSEDPSQKALKRGSPPVSQNVVVTQTSFETLSVPKNSQVAQEVSPCVLGGTLAALVVPTEIEVEGSSPDFLQLGLLPSVSGSVASTEVVIMHSECTKKGREDQSQIALKRDSPLVPQSVVITQTSSETLSVHVTSQISQEIYPCVLGGTLAASVLPTETEVEGPSSECLQLGLSPSASGSVASTEAVIMHSECTKKDRESQSQIALKRDSSPVSAVVASSSMHLSGQIPLAAAEIVHPLQEDTLLDKQQDSPHLDSDSHGHLPLPHEGQQHNVEGLKVVHCKVLHHATGRNFYCSIVYGSNNADTRKRLWTAMECFASHVDKWAAMGDFNVIRQPTEKLSNTPPVLSNLLDFNSCLSNCELDDLSSYGCDFTWYNKQDATTRVYSKLDRILVNNARMQHFSQTTGQFLSPGISDHSHVVLTFHDADAPKKQFKFLNCSMDHPEFHSIVAKCWVAHQKGNSMFRLMQKLKNVKQGLKQLQASHFADIETKVKEKREALSQCFHDLQKWPDSHDLLEKEKQLCTDIWQLKDIELMILAQRAKAHNIKYNDTCSKFFFAKIKERQQSQMIGEIKGVYGTRHQGLHSVGEAFVDYYQQLLGEATPTTPISPDVLSNGACVKLEDYPSLLKPISRVEIKQSLFDIDSNKSPGLDGFSSGFFKAAWDIVGNDYCLAIEDFFKNGFMPKQANVTLVTLISKKDIPQTVKDFRPISCCSTIYKTVSKILTNRLKDIMVYLVGPEQAAFVKDRNLFENVMLTQSLVKGYTRKHITPRCMLKVDISKAFDTLQWKFIQDMLTGLNFPPRFVSWVMGCITGSWFTFKVNGSNHGFFKGKSGVRQSDPLSPFLFVLSMEILSRKVRVMCNKQNISYHPKCSKLGLTHLVFADDLMIFVRGDLPSVQQAVDTLKVFSEWSGLKANMEKTEAYLGGMDQNLRSLILSTVGIQEGEFPFRYLGLPINSSRLTRNMYDALLLKIHKITVACSTKFLSYAGRRTVLNSNLFGLCNFWCISFLLPRLVHKTISQMSKNFFWGQIGNERRLVYKNWLSVCAPWDEGGFHIKDMEGWNKATLLKWLWCLDKNKGAIWISWVKHYITATCSIWDLAIQEQHSECLRGILHVRDIRLLQLGNVSHVQRLLDSCVTQNTLSISKAYELFRKKYPIHPAFKAIHTGTTIPRHQVITMLAVQGSSHLAQVESQKEALEK